MTDQIYAGFWIRAWASTIDTMLMLLIFVPVVTLAYGMNYWLTPSLTFGVVDSIMQFFFPVVAVLAFWIYKSATPGKMLTKIQIVDAKTGAKPTAGKFVLRYIGYILASIPLGLGIFWVAFNKQKRGWHDLLAGTVVIVQTEGTS